MKNDGVLMSAEELPVYLGITRNAAYTLLHRADFPVLKIGNLLYAVRAEVDNWIAQQVRNGGYIYGEEERER